MCAIRQGSERFNSEVYPRLLSSGRKRLYGHIRTREADVPPIRFPADRDRLDRSLYRTGPAHGDAPDLGQDQKTIIETCAAMLAHLWIGETGVAVTPMKTGIAWCLPFAETAEEGLEGPVYAQDHVLQHLSIDFAILRHRFFDAGQFRLLLIVGDRHTALLPRLTSLSNSSVVDMAAERQNAFKFLLLSRGRFELVFVGFVKALFCHARIFCPIGENPAQLVLSASSRVASFPPRASRRGTQAENMFGDAPGALS
jgi:hypothetical protein